MKVYIINRSDFPFGMAAVNRIKCYAKAIASAGVECEVIVYRRSNKIDDTYFSTNNSGVWENIPFRYIGRSPFRPKNLFKRKFLDWKDKLSFLRFLKHTLNEGDLVLGYISDDIPFINRYVLPIIHSRKAALVQDLGELPYGTGAETPKAQKLRKYTLEKEFPRIDGVIPISEELAILAEKHIGDKENILKVPILVDFEKFSLPDKSNQAAIPYIFHSGTLYEQKDGILGMIEAFGIARQSIDIPVKFYLTGKIDKSPHAQEIKELIERYSLHDSVVFLGYLSQDDLKKYLSESSLVIINKYETMQNRYCFSTKLGEYMAAGKPAIITRVGEAMNWLSDGKDCVIVNPGDTDSIAEKIIELMSDAALRKEIGNSAKNTCKESFDYHIWGNRIVDFFKKIQDKKNCFKD